MKIFQKSKLFLILLAFIAIPLIVSNAMATRISIFQDSFDSENSGVMARNYADFTNWIVTDGTVDLVGNGWGDVLPGNGLYVDLDGSTFDAGILTSSTQFTFEGGYWYELTFDLAGSQRVEDTNTVTIGDMFIKSYTLTADAPFTTITEYFYINSTTQGYVSFANLGGDNIGLHLDNVELAKWNPEIPPGVAQVPEPTTILLLGIGLIGVGIFRKRFLKK